MALIKVFLSHSYHDNAFCQQLVDSLRAAGADVWYDDESLHAGQLGPVIERELRDRPVFIVVLSPAAIASHWVEEETRWAYNRLRRDSRRILLPVLAEPLGDADDIWLFLQDFRRIGATDITPFAHAEAIARTLHALQLTSPGEAPRPVAPQPDESAADLVTRAAALMLQGKPTESMVLLQRATELDPMNANTWARLSTNLSMAGRPVDALLASERALSLDATSGDAWAAKAIGLGRLGEHEEALAAASQAVTADPNSSRAWEGYSIALANLKRYDEALVAEDRALALDPDHLSVLNNKGTFLSRVGRYQEAFDVAERAMAIGGESPAVWDTKGEALLGMGRFEEALLALNRSLVLDPDSLDSVETWEKKATALRALGRESEAEEALRRAKALHK